MTAQHQNLFALIRMTLEPVKLELADPDWDEILSIAKEQALSGFIAESALSCGASNSALWKKEFYGQLQTYLDIAAAQGELHRLLSDAGIGYVTLKGFAAAVYYPQSSIRTMGDIDLLVRPEDYQKTHELLQNAGFTDDDEEKEERHIGLMWQGVRYELHHCFAADGELPTGGMRRGAARQLVEEFNDLIVNCIEEARAECIPDENADEAEQNLFSRPPDLINGLILLQHVNHHMKTGLGLRQILDWDVFLAANQTAPWMDEFWNLAEHFHLRTLAEYLTALCQSYFGLDVQLSQDVDPAVCRALLEKIFKDGNFGHADFGISTKMRRVLNQSRGVLARFQRLQRGGLCRWEAAKKHAVLRPFAWAYQLFRVMPQLLKRDHAVSNMKQEIASANQEHELLVKLGLAEP